MNRTLSTLSLARRASRLAIGFTATKNAMLQKQSSLVLFSSDISDGTKKKILQIIGDTPYVDMTFSSEEIEKVLRRRFVVAAITDNNFKQLFMKALKEGV